jgi:hypothetical protein
MVGVEICEWSSLEKLTRRRTAAIYLHAYILDLFVGSHQHRQHGILSAEGQA